MIKIWIGVWHLISLVRKFPQGIRINYALRSQSLSLSAIFFRIAIWPFLTMFARNKMIFPIVNFSLLHRHVWSLCVAIKTFKPSSRFVTWTHGVLTFWWFRNNQFKNVTKIHVIRKKLDVLTNCKNAFMAVISPLKMHL